ncbi:MAG TPA: alpha/beta hydrolase [Hyphomicrobiales bacterium]|jgi:2-hydroxy-6-oxo-6-(2'-carboxyphenyl)-hexa-2,4-dienoate hydrolase
MTAQGQAQASVGIPTVNPATALAEYETRSLFPAQATSRFVTVDGYRTHYLEAGRPGAPKLLLVHGAACSIGLGTERWHPLIGPLSERFHVFAVDELGQGRTEPPRDFRQLGHTRVRAEHVVAFMQTMGFGPIHVVGQSQGCWIAAYAALTHPELVAKLVLVDSASTSGVETAKPNSNELLPYSQNLFRPGTRIPKMDLKTREGVRSMIGEFCYDKAALSEQLVEHALQLAQAWGDLYRAHDEMTWANGQAAGMDWRREQYSYNARHISHAIGEIGAPTLVIWGRNSNKGLDAGFEMYKKLPRAQMHILDRANHFVWIDRPMAFNGLVSWYLGDCD